MDLKPNAHVACTDGSVGRLEDIILNPHTERVTYLVVGGNDAPNTQKLVPEGLVKEAAGDTITLSIARAKFWGLKNYIQEAYIPSSVMLYLADTAGWNLGRPAGVIMEHPAVPAGGLAVHKGGRCLCHGRACGTGG